MAQIIKFFSWILWGIATTVLGVGMLSVALIDDTQTIRNVFSDPISIAFMLGAYIPGGLLYMIAIWVGKISDKQAVAHRQVMAKKEFDKEAEASSKASTET